MHIFWGYYLERYKLTYLFYKKQYFFLQNWCIFGLDHAIIRPVKYV